MSTIPAESTTAPAKALSFPTATEQDPRWARVIARDRAADGAFFYSVATTGVYCRPSCASRRANPKNVRFYETTAACEAAGFRACKRCKPDQLSQEAQNAEKIARACRLVARAEEPPTLAEMARSEVAYDVGALLNVGCSPAAAPGYARSVGRRLLSLNNGASCTEA